MIIDVQQDSAFPFLAMVALSSTALDRDHNIIIYLNCGFQACVTIYRPGHNVSLGLDWPQRRSQ